LSDRIGRIFLVTGNSNKLLEVRSILGPYGIRVEPARVEKVEVQGDIELVSRVAAVIASSELLEPVVVDDSGLYVEVLNGFPGPYSSYAYEKLGNSGLLKLMEGQKDRRATFRCAVTYADALSREIKAFAGEVEGFIRLRPGKENGFGFDPIFSVEGPEGKPFSELSVEEKDRVSHRGVAFRKLAEYLGSAEVGRRKAAERRWERVVREGFTLLRCTQVRIGIPIVRVELGLHGFTQLPREFIGSLPLRPRQDAPTQE